MVENNNLKPVMERYGLKDLDLEFIKEMIGGPDGEAKDQQVMVNACVNDVKSFFLTDISDTV